MRPGTRGTAAQLSHARQATCGWAHAVVCTKQECCLQAPFHRVKDFFANNDAFVTARRSGSGNGRASGGRPLPGVRSLTRHATLDSNPRLRPTLSDVPLHAPSLMASLGRPSLDAADGGLGDLTRDRIDRLAHA